MCASHGRPRSGQTDLRAGRASAACGAEKAVAQVAKCPSRNRRRRSPASQSSRSHLSGVHGTPCGAPHRLLAMAVRRPLTAEMPDRPALGVPRSDSRPPDPTKSAVAPGAAGRQRRQSGCSGPRRRSPPFPGPRSRPGRRPPAAAASPSAGVWGLRRIFDGRHKAPLLAQRWRGNMTDVSVGPTPSRTRSRRGGVPRHRRKASA
jgi:hypothetical protein